MAWPKWHIVPWVGPTTSINPFTLGFHAHYCVLTKNHLYIIPHHKPTKWPPKIENPQNGDKTLEGWRGNVARVTPGNSSDAISIIYIISMMKRE
jgi:hypothetical protein